MQQVLDKLFNLITQRNQVTIIFKKVDEIEKEINIILNQLNKQQIKNLMDLACCKIKKYSNLLYKYDKLLKHNNKTMPLDKQKLILNKMSVYAEIKSKCKQQIELINKEFDMLK